MPNGCPIKSNKQAERRTQRTSAFHTGVSDPCLESITAGIEKVVFNKRPALARSKGAYLQDKNCVVGSQCHYRLKPRPLIKDNYYQLLPITTKLVIRQNAD